MLLVGPIGPGTTHLGLALGVEAARPRRRVGFWRTAELVRARLEAIDARELGRLQRRLARLDLVICDERGGVPFDRAGGERRFSVIAERYERGRVLVTSPSPSGSGRRAGEVMRSSPRRSWTGWPTTRP